VATAEWKKMDGAHGDPTHRKVKFLFIGCPIDRDLNPRLEINTTLLDLTYVRPYS